MFELFFIWAILIAGLGFIVILTVMAVRHVLTALGRIVFFEGKGTDTTLNANAA